MIQVEKTTYITSPRGMTREVFEFDDSKKMKIYIDGELFATQVGEFKVFEEDWNCDNDVYELYGAYFSQDHCDTFYTPKDIVGIICDKKAVIEYV